MPFGDNVKEVKLPEKTSTFPQPGQKCVMKGWGCTKGGKLRQRAGGRYVKAKGL
jgi:hypothetical protein